MRRKDRFVITILFPNSVDKAEMKAEKQIEMQAVLMAVFSIFNCMLFHRVFKVFGSLLLNLSFRIFFENKVIIHWQDLLRSRLDTT